MLLKIQVFWDIMLCQLADGCQCFGELKMWALISIETLVIIYQSTQHNIPEAEMTITILFASL